MQTPDDEYLEEPHVEEGKFPKETPNAVKLANMRIHKNLGDTSNNDFVALCELVERTRSRFERRMNSS